MNDERKKPILAPVSAGELLDKISILEIKAERVRDPAKRSMAQHELDQLNHVREQHVPDSAEVNRYCFELKSINEVLWDIEDRIRLKEHASSFDGEFIGLARAVYKTNDQRAAIKSRLNALLSSDIVEVKDYQ